MTNEHPIHLIRNQTSSGVSISETKRFSRVDAPRLSVQFRRPPRPPPPQDSNQQTTRWARRGCFQTKNRDKNKSISRPVQRYEVRSQVFSSSQDNRVGVRIEVPGAATVVNSRNLPSTWLRKSVRRGWEGSWDSLRCFGGGGWGWTHGHVDAC